MKTLALLGLLTLPLSGAPCAEPLPAACGVDEVDDLITRGRDLLDVGKADEAEGLFLQAEALEESPRTRMWVLRAWISAGRVNDALEGIDALKRDGHRGSDLDYLYGMAMAGRAQELINGGMTGDPALGMNLLDAEEKLQKATEADPVKYRDAFLPLCFAAMQNQNFGLSRHAGEKAIELFPTKPQAHVMLGRTCMFLYQEAAAVEGRADEADEQRDRAIEAFRAGIEHFGEPGEDAPGARAELANAAYRLGNAHAYGGELEDAGWAYETSLAWDPSQSDIGVMNNVLGLEVLVPLLQRANEGFVARYGDENVGNAALLQWLGWGAFMNGDLEAAEPALIESVEKWPPYASNWYWVYRTRYSAQDYEGCYDALAKGWRADGPTTLSMLNGEQDLNLQILHFLAAWSMEQQRHDLGIEAYRLCTEMQPDNSKWWGFRALFMRDRGEYLEVTLGDDATDEQREEIVALYEGSWTTYQVAIETDPRHPAHWNDGAVILHYYLERDYDRAIEMYDKAEELGEERLEAQDYPPEEDQVYRYALRDARNNRALLRAKMAGEADG